MSIQQNQGKQIGHTNTCQFTIGNSFDQIKCYFTQPTVSIILYNSERKMINKQQIKTKSFSLTNSLFYQETWFYNYVIEDEEREIREKEERKFVKQKNTKPLVVDEWNNHALLLRIDLFSWPEDIHLYIEEKEKKKIQEKSIKIQQRGLSLEGLVYVSQQAELQLHITKYTENDDKVYAAIPIDINNLECQQNQYLFHIKQEQVNQLIDGLGESQRSIVLQNNQFKCEFYHIKDFVESSEQEILKIQNIFTEPEINLKKGVISKSLPVQIIKQAREKAKVMAQSDVLTTDRDKQQQSLQELLKQNMRQFTKGTDVQNKRIIKFQCFFEEFEIAAQGQSKRDQLQPLIEEVSQLYKQIETKNDQRNTEQGYQEKISNLKLMISDQKETMTHMTEKIRKIQNIKQRLEEQLKTFTLNEQLQNLQKKIQDFCQELEDDQQKLQVFHSNQAQLLALITNLKKEKTQLNNQINQLKQSEQVQQCEIKSLTEKNEKLKDTVQVQLRKILYFIRKNITLRARNQSNFQTLFLRASRQYKLTQKIIGVNIKVFTFNY